MTTKVRYRVGDSVTVLCTTTDSQDITTDVTVLKWDRLGCGCQRLVAQRPGPQTPGTRMDTMHILTGCAYHNGEVIS